MYFSDRSHKSNQSLPPAAATAMAPGAEEGSLEVTVWPPPRDAEDRRSRTAEPRQGRGCRDYAAPLTADLAPGRPRPFLRYWI